jgi:hypothetical protein
MSNPINIDHNCNEAIRQEIGAQLRAYLPVSPRLPARLRKKVDRLYKLEGQSPPSDSRSGTWVQKQAKEGRKLTRYFAVAARRRKDQGGGLS